MELKPVGGTPDSNRHFSMERPNMIADKSDEETIFLDDGDLNDSFEMVCLNDHVPTPIPLDTECIDLSDLSKIRSEGGVIIIDSDDDDDNGDSIDGTKDDDDVVFMGSYIQEGAGVQKRCQDKNVRRNPMRSARNKLRGHSDLLYEDDLMLLSGSDGASDKENESPPESSPTTPGPSRRPQQQQRRLPKEWPINVHERPEYDVVAKRVHPLDRAMREVGTRPTATAPAPRRQPGRRGGRRRGRSERLRPASNLVPRVEETLEAVRGFVGEECSVITEEQKVELLRNTMMMLMFVKDCDQEELIREFLVVDGKMNEQDCSVSVYKCDRSHGSVID